MINGQVKLNGRMEEGKKGRPGSSFLPIILSLLLPLAAGATTYPLTVKDCRGKSVTIPREPKRIVSTAPNNTEILYALGLESRIVGVTRFCNYPVAARKKPKVGDRTTSAEKVISLKPDLVVAHGFLNDDAVRSMESHGLRVVAIDPKTLDQVMADIKLLGKITNREKQASQIAGRISSARALVAKQTAGAKTHPKTLVLVQADPPWVAGPKTFVDEMIRLAGGTNVAADARPGFSQFSAETAVARGPDVIIGTAKGDKQTLSKGFWKNTNAVRKGRVHEADPDILVRPGPRLADGILAVAKLIQPTAF